MRRLQRENGPACLGKYRYQTNKWADVTPADKAEIWRELDSMQGFRCAYCEAEITGENKHIEHFSQRRSSPRLTFEWSNLFGSCNRLASCGRHKDSCGDYEPDLLIKPDVDDPEKFLLFVSDGTIAIRQGLSADDARRAKETLRVLNLDAEHGPLRRMRQQAVAGYLQSAEEFIELAKHYPIEEISALIDLELTSTVNLPFRTAIKHVFSL